ncbi:LysR family transcriptional regulator [Albirhodobacter sp. R86504]|jgi:DNA-binding transcriptional LysR family regulator|uniref:LysR family transcriptional regulator n=1 Tax=Albirhodobacter sp. R86504 TaxID=3093848 RepID=UPI0036733444
MLNLAACRYFAEVARFGSLRAAADRLHVAPSAISRQLAKLEHELDVQLLERHSNGVRLTEAGALLQRHLTTVFDTIDLARGEIADLKGLKRGQVSLATVEGITRPFLSEKIAAFRRDFPSIEMRVRIRGRERVLEALEHHICQIGILYDHFSHPVIETVGKWHQPLLALVPQDHPFADGRPVDLNDIKDLPCVMPDDSFGIHHLVNRVYAKIGAVPNAVLMADQFHFLIDHALRTGAIVFLPLQGALTEVQSGQLVPLNLTCKDFEYRYIYAVTRRDQQLPPAAAAFLRYILSEFKASEASDIALLAKIRGA